MLIDLLNGRIFNVNPYFLSETEINSPKIFDKEFLKIVRLEGRKVLKICSFV